MSVSYSWMGLSPMVWSLVSVVSSTVGLWVLGRVARQARGWVLLATRLLAGFFQFSCVLCGLSTLVVHMSPQAQVVVTIVAASVGTAVWRFYVMASAPRVLTQRDSAALGTATPVHEGTAS